MAAAVFVFFSDFRASQTVSSRIYGVVREKASDEFLEGVNVFLNGTTFGAATNSEGYFAIERIPAGEFTIVVSMIGFEIEKRIIRIEPGASYEFNFYLLPKVYKLDQVYVVDKQNEMWQRQFRTFINHFIGSSENSAFCVITNPEIINLTYNESEGTLKASSNGWIVIINNALGYKLKFNLIEFSLSSRTETSFFGEVSFEELRGNLIEQEKWKANRLYAYNGSQRHFFRALSNNRLLNEGFNVYVTDLPRWSELTSTNLFRPDFTSRLDTISSWEMGLYFDKYSKINYVTESEDPAYSKFRAESGSKIDAVLNSQTSWFKLPHGYITFDIFGNILGKSTIKVFGYWAWQRIADLLPRDYLPEE